MYSLDPPGRYYEDWVDPGARMLEEGPDALLAAMAEELDPEASELDTVKILVRYGEIYGWPVPVTAARHLDAMVELAGLADQFAFLEGITQDEALASIHSLHARGLLLIDDDGAVWMSVPPGTPYSAPNGEWALVERRSRHPRSSARQHSGPEPAEGPARHVPGHAVPLYDAPRVHDDTWEAAARVFTCPASTAGCGAGAALAAARSRFREPRAGRRAGSYPPARG